MTDIFNMRYPAGGSMVVYQDAGNPDRVYVRNEGSTGAISCHLNKPGVERLHKALGEWLAGREEKTIPWKNRSKRVEVKNGHIETVSVPGKRGKVVIAEYFELMDDASETVLFMTPAQLRTTADLFSAFAEEVEHRDSREKQEKIDQINKLVRELGEDSRSSVKQKSIMPGFRQRPKPR